MSTTKVTGMMQTSTKGGDITSASPCVIDTDGDYFDVTGTTNFAAFTVVAGRRFTIQFDGVLTMTHHATTLDLPGGANITTAAGDVAEFFATGTNTVQCVSYTKADGTAVVVAAGGGWEYVSVQTGSGVSDLAFTNMVSGYDYEYVLDKIVGGTDGAGFYLVLGVAGPTYRTATYETQLTEVSTHASGGTVQARADASRVDILDTAESALGTGTNEALHLGKLFLNNPVGTSNETAVLGSACNFGSDPATAEVRTHHFAAIYETVEAHTSIKFETTTGTFSGSIFQYRRKRS